MKKIGCGWKWAGDGLNYPGKIILHKIRVYFLQSRENVSAGDDQPGNIKRPPCTLNIGGIP
jgi:hypothetical protein